MGTENSTPDAEAGRPAPSCPARCRARALSPEPTHLLISAITTVLSIATCTARALQVSKTASFLPGRGGHPDDLPGSSLLASASCSCAGEVAQGPVQGATSQPGQHTGTSQKPSPGLAQPEAARPPQSTQPVPPTRRANSTVGGAVLGGHLWWRSHGQREGGSV